MNGLIRLSIERPIAVIAAVLMIIMFGAVALTKIPIQLTPDVQKPVISIETIWPGAAPAEIEREITNRQEEVLRGLEGLHEISSESQDGRSRITLEFAVGQDMTRALLLTANRLDRVNGYPAEADEPFLKAASADDNPIAWFILTRTGDNKTPIHTFGDFAEDVIQDRLERVPGVARVNVYGAAKREMVVSIDPEMLARYRLTVTDVIDTLRAANSSVSAGDVDEGKRRYVVRTEGDFSKLEDVEKVVIRSLGDGSSGIARVTVADIAKVRFDYSDPTARISINGFPGIAMNTVRETGANVIEVMKGIRAAVAELNERQLPSRQLKLRQVYDETVYIDSSIDLVQQNIIVGGLLAAFILLLFLRSGGATLIVSLAIPVSVIGAFVAMAFLGRSINVISLAGIAFAVGMVVDAAIVVLENIYRLREKGMNRAEAAYQGARQVWVAVLVSALTTVMVFIPILVMELEVGQLFRDIAVALSVSVMLSLLVAITVIPALAKRLLGGAGTDSMVHRRIPVVDNLAEGFVRTVLRFTRYVIASRLRSVLVVAAICGTAAVVTHAFLPKLEYLPDGNRNLIFGILVPPPGYNLDTTEEIASRFEAKIRPLLAELSGPESKPGEPPKIERFFFVATRGVTFVGAIAQDPARVRELIPILKDAAFQEPGTFGQISQRSLFGRGVGGSRSIDLNVLGADLEDILSTTLKALALVQETMPLSKGTQISPKPGLEMGAPEIRVYPNRVKLADNGVTAKQLSDTMDTFNDGLRVAEITNDNKRINLMLKGPDNLVRSTQGIDNLPVVTPAGIILPTSQLADIVITSGPTQINHLERARTVTLQIRPPDGIPLEVALNQLQTDVIDKLRAEGLPDGIKLRMTGTADSLNDTWAAMKFDLLIAVVIVYLVMAVLFESFFYPMVIMLSVPLATAGGVLGLVVMNMFVFQALDMLTLLGFVILIGIVVNNAILLVHQTLHHMREED
ncbi:MAG: efflux RND transporter permease subunit, partial [Proteobacteria bacterium]|nr:efflux RND transporter permease subunit [Pseudomonadota bacterium]